MSDSCLSQAHGSVVADGAHRGSMTMEPGTVPAVVRLPYE